MIKDIKITQLAQITTLVLAVIGSNLMTSATSDELSAQEPVFGAKFPKLESRATGEWWKVKPSKRASMDLDVPRDEVVAFAVYTHNHGTLKLSAQLFPLKPDEAKLVRLEFKGADNKGEPWAVGHRALQKARPLTRHGSLN